MIEAHNRSLVGPTIVGAHLALVVDAPSGPAGPRPACGVSDRLSIAIIAMALLAFVLIR